MLWHRTLRETEAERISQEFATGNPEGAHPPVASHSDGRKLCPECSSEQISGTPQCNVCGFLFDVEPEAKGTQEEIEAAKKDWTSHRREMTLRRKEKQTAMLRKLGFEELDSRVLREINYEDELFRGREGRGCTAEAEEGREASATETMPSSGIA